MELQCIAHGLDENVHIRSTRVLLHGFKGLRHHRQFAGNSRLLFCR